MSTVENHIARAAQAFEAGDLRHAAHHIGAGLAESPHDPTVLAYFDAAYNHTPDPLTQVFPISQNVSLGDAVAHALALGRSGHHDQAFSLLCQLGQQSPGGFLSWMADWPLPSATALRSGLATLMQQSTPEAAAAARAAMLDRVVDAYPADAEMLALASVIARKARDLAAAKAWAHQSLGVHENWLAANALAAACRDSGDVDGAHAAWKNCVSLAPSDPFAWLDWADFCVAHGDLNGADDKYRQALVRAPDNEWAHASLAYTYYLRNRSGSGWVGFRSWSLANPRNERARSTLQADTPWLGRLPMPTEVLYHAAVNVPDEQLQSAVLNLSHLEGPSPTHCLRTAAPGFDAQVGAMQSPDPRTTVFETRQLWSWDGVVPSPAVAPPPPNVQETVEWLAGQPFDAEQWLKHARAAVRRASPAVIEGLLGAAVHPVPRATIADTMQWFWRCQHAAAFLLAGAPSSGAGSQNLVALDGMVAVRSDWNAQAGLAALIALAEANSGLRDHVWARCVAVLQSPPSGGSFPTATIAAWGLLRLDPRDDAGAAVTACTWLDAEDFR